MTHGIRLPSSCLCNGCLLWSLQLVCNNVLHLADHIIIAGNFKDVNLMMQVLRTKLTKSMGLVKPVTRRDTCHGSVSSMSKRFPCCAAPQVVLLVNSATLERMKHVRVLDNMYIVKV